MESFCFHGEEEAFWEHTYPLTLVGFFICLYQSPSQSSFGSNTYTALQISRKGTSTPTTDNQVHSMGRYADSAPHFSYALP